MLFVIWIEYFIGISEFNVTPYIKGISNVSNDTLKSSSHPSNVNGNVITQEQKPFKKKPKVRYTVILLWNPKYRSLRDVKRCLRRNCPRAKCVVTQNKRLVNRSDAIVFEGETLNRVSPPKRKRAGQVCTEA